MDSRTQRSNPQLVAPANSPELLELQAGVVPRASDEGEGLMGLDENTVDRSEGMKRLLEKTFDWVDTDQDSLTIDRAASDPVVERPTSRTELNNMMEVALN